MTRTKTIFSLDRVAIHAASTKLRKRFPSFRPARALAALAAVLVLSGCPQTYNQQLESMAKDWSMTIRASQIIPVYPLTEDLRPGDVFAVSTPVSEQILQFDQKGFLPLDQIVVRLDSGPSSATWRKFYKDDYADGYFASDYRSVPHRLDSSADQTGAEAPMPAPRAAFPSYTFEVNRAGGFAMALPIQGVPVAMGMMGAKAARVVVNIGDAYTYGVDSSAAYAALLQWAEQHDVRQTLGAMAQQIDHALWLRVVTRVYFARSLSVSVFDADNASGNLGVGANPPKPSIAGAAAQAQAGVNPSSASGNTAKEKGSGTTTTPSVGKPAPSNTLATSLTESLKAASEANTLLTVPNAGFSFELVSTRSVSLVQTFKRPVVLGYVGFDVRVDPKTGNISPPVPSFAVLNRAVSTTSVVPNGNKDELNRAIDALNYNVVQGSGNAKRVIDAIAKNLGSDFQALYAAQLKKNRNEKCFDAFYAAERAYLNEAKTDEYGRRKRAVIRAINNGIMTPANRL